MNGSKNGFSVPAWAREGRHSLHPSWTDVCSISKERVEAAADVSDNLQRECADLWRKSQESEGKGMSKRERERLRTRAKSLVSILETIQSDLEESQCRFESSALGESLQDLLRALSDHILKSSREDVTDASSRIDSLKKYWIYQLSALKYNKVKMDKKYPSTLAHRATQGERAAADSEQQERALERQLKKTQSRVAKLEREKREKADEAYRLKMQMQGLVDGLKKKAEEIVSLKMLINQSAQASPPSPLASNSSGSGHATPQSKGSFKWEKKAQEGSPEPAGERENGETGADSGAGKEILLAVPNLDVDFMPFKVVDARHYDQSIRVSSAERAETSGRAAYVADHNMKLTELLRDQAFALPAWEDRLNVGRLRRKMDALSDLHSALSGLERGGTETDAFVHKYAEFKTRLRRTSAELGGDLAQNQRAWALHIDKQKKRIKQMLALIGQPSGWVENSAAIKQFVEERSPVECSDSILQIVKCYEDWLMGFMGKHERFMMRTDAKRAEFLEAWTAENFALQEYVHETHSGLMNVGNLVSAARALLSKLKLKQEDLNNRGTAVSLRIECDSHEEYLSEMERKNKVIQALNHYAKIRQEVRLLRGRNIKMKARSQMIQLQNGSENTKESERLRKISLKNVQTIKEMEKAQHKLKKFLEDCGVPSESLLAAVASLDSIGAASEKAPLKLCERGLGDYSAITTFSRNGDILYARLGTTAVLLHRLKFAESLEELSRVTTFLLKLKSISHPALLPIECAFLDENCVFLQKTYLPDLVTFENHFSSQNQIDALYVCDQFRQLLQCLAYLNRKRIYPVISMQTVFLDASGDVKIAEFDASDLVSASEGPSAEQRSHHSSFISMSMSASATPAPNADRKEEKEKESKALANLRQFGHCLHSCFFPESVGSVPSPGDFSAAISHENGHLTDLLGQLLQIDPCCGPSERGRHLSADEVLAHPFFSGGAPSRDGPQASQTWKFSLVDEMRAQLMAGKEQVRVVLECSGSGETSFVRSVLRAFRDLLREDILRPMVFEVRGRGRGRGAEAEVVGADEALLTFFREIGSQHQHGLMERFAAAGNVLPDAESKDLAVFRAIGMALAKCVLENVRLPRDYWNSSFFKFLRGEPPQLGDLVTFHQVYANHIRQVFLNKNVSKLEEMAQSTGMPGHVWTQNPLVLFQAVVSKMLVGSRARQLGAIKAAFFDAIVDLKHHLNIFSSADLQELIQGD